MIQIFLATIVCLATNQGATLITIHGHETWLNIA